jgi:hypothetical protein
MWSVSRVGLPGDVEAEDRDVAIDHQQRSRLAVVEVGGHPWRVRTTGVFPDDEAAVEHSRRETACPVDEQTLLSGSHVDGDKPPTNFVVDDVVQTGYEVMPVEPSAVGRMRDYCVQALPARSATEVWQYTSSRSATYTR